MDSDLHDHRVPPAVVRWLLLVASTFVAGCLTIALLPSHQASVVDVGVCINVAMAIGIGVVLAWRGSPQRLFCAAGAGAVVTVLGWDLLTFTQAQIRGLGGLVFIPLDAIALPVAGLGMVLLVGVGAALGGIGRVCLLSTRWPCRRWRPRLSPPTP
jgi:hypothetical protein